MVFANQKGGENQKEEDQEQVKDLGKSKNQKISANRVPLAQPPPRKNHFELRFRRKREDMPNRPSEETAILSKLVKTTPRTTPLFFMISTFQQAHRKRVPIAFSVSSFVSAETAQKTLIEESRFLENQLALILRIFRTDKGTQFASN